MISAAIASNGAFAAASCIWSAPILGLVGAATLYTTHQSGGPDCVTTTGSGRRRDTISGRALVVVVRFPATSRPGRGAARAASIDRRKRSTSVLRRVTQSGDQTR